MQYFVCNLNLNFPVALPMAWLSHLRLHRKHPWHFLNPALYRLITIPRLGTIIGLLLLL